MKGNQSGFLSEVHMANIMFNLPYVMPVTTPSCHNNKTAKKGKKGNRQLHITDETAKKVADG